MKPLNPNDWPKLIHPGSRVFLGGGAAVPLALIRSMLDHAAFFKDVELVHINGLGETPWIDPKYEQVLRTNSFFLTPVLRDAVERGQADYTPCAMSEIPLLFKSKRLAVDVALVQVSPPDSAGWCSLGVSVDVSRAAVESAHMVVAQINSQMPRTCGDSLISIKKIDWFIEHSAPLPEADAILTDDRYSRIGCYAAQLVEDGSTLQVGLGNSPDAVARALYQHKHLGVHTGVLTDALMHLVKCGAVDHSMKNYRPGKIIASHVLGSRELYQFVDCNEEIEFHPSDWVNDPSRIARNVRMVAINGAREIDLTGQVVRDSTGHRFYGGVGALQDFIRGAGRSKKGCPIIALTSTSDENGQSRVVAQLQEGSGVATGRGDVHYVVTEYGVASLYGCSIRERVARLVDVAHPDHREALLAGAQMRGWLPKFYTMPATEAKLSEDGIESSWIKFQDSRLFLRPLHPSDMRILQEFFYSHDEETVRLRYGYQRERMTGESAYKLAAVDQTKDLAIAIFSEDPGRQSLRAIGRYYLDPDGKKAEIAFVVHETTRHSGIAGFLLGELAAVAGRRGVKELWANVMPDNRAMAGLFLAVGGHVENSSIHEERTFIMSVKEILKTRPEFLERKKIQRIER
jgi:acyl-CoA hydrolase/RimJ/RimL family protein N-acetyltransferase